MEHIKVVVRVEIDVDPEIWAKAYGMTAESAPLDAREYLPEAVASRVASHLGQAANGATLVSSELVQ